MRTLLNACLGMVYLLTTSGAMPQTPRGDSEVLREDVLPALELVADPAFAEIIRPYADCYARAVATSYASSLKDNRTVQITDELADNTCSTLKLAVTKKADAALMVRSPSLSDETRSVLLGRVRQQTAFFALAAEYQLGGHGPTFQSYLERSGREMRAGRSVIMLSGK